MTNPVMGLMFKIKPKPQVFKWEKPVYKAIHSWFVWKPFLARWYLKGLIVDEQVIKPWRMNVFPKGEFDELYEVSLSDFTKSNKDETATNNGNIERKLKGGI